MKDIVEDLDLALILDPQTPQQAKANYKDFITIRATVKGGGNLLKGQRVLFALSGKYASFKELANQKIIGTTDSSGMVIVHLMSNNLEKGTVTVTVIDSASVQLTAPQSVSYEFIKDPDLAIAVAIEKDGAKADGSEQNIVAVSLTNLGQPLQYATVDATVDGKALFVPVNDKETQATTDSKGVARFYMIDGNNLHENVTFTAYYEQAQWLSASTVVAFSDAYNFDISLKVLSNFNTPGTSPNVVRIELLNNKQVASGFEVICSLPSSSGATFAANGGKQLMAVTDKYGYLTVDINDTKVEKVRMEAYVVLQPDRKDHADLEWQRYALGLNVNPNYSLPDGIAQNKVNATLTNDGVRVPSEELIFKIDERSKSKFVDTGTKTTNRTTLADGTASAAIVSKAPETYPVTVALARFPTLNSTVNSAFGAYVLTVTEVKNNAYSDGKDENRVTVLLTNSDKAVPRKKLSCEMRNKHAVFTSNHQYTSEVTTDDSGKATIAMVGSSSFQDVLRVTVEDDTSVYKEVVLNWRSYTITQDNPNANFIVGNTGIVTVQVKDNGTPVEGIDVVFPSPYNSDQKTTSTGKASATYAYNTPTTVRANVYLKNVPSVTTQTSIQFVNQYSYTGPTKTYVPYGYDLRFRIIDNSTSSGSVAYTSVDAYLTSTLQYFTGSNDMWFENHTGNLTPLYKSYQTDGNGVVTLPIRWLLNQPSVYRSETLTLYVRGKKVVSYNVTNG